MDHLLECELLAIGCYVQFQRSHAKASLSLRAEEIKTAGRTGKILPICYAIGEDHQTRLDDDPGTNRSHDRIVQRLENWDGGGNSIPDIEGFGTLYSVSGQ